MQLPLVVALLLTLTAAESAPTTPGGTVWLRLLVVAGLAAMVAATAWAGAGRLRASLVREPGRAVRWGESFRRLQRLHAGLWLAFVVFCLYGCGWPQVVRGDWHLDDVPLLDDWLLLAPLLAPLVLSWAGYYRFEQAAERLAAARAGRPRPRVSLVDHLLLECRQTFGLLLAPLLAVLALDDVLTPLVPAGWTARYGWTLHAGLLLAMLVLMPSWLRRLWGAEPLPAGARRTRLTEAARRARLRLRDMLVWRTDEQVANAAVAGLLPRMRYVYFSDLLLSVLDDEELEAVLLHEAAHIRRRHLLVRLMMLGLPLAVATAAQGWWPDAAGSTPSSVAGAGLPHAWQTAVLLPAAAALWAAVALGAVARWLEHDADLWAAQRQGDAAALVSALGKLARLSPDPHRPTWLHPSLISRIVFLRVAASQPSRAARFQRRLTAAGAGLALAVGSLVAIAAQ